MARRPYHLPNWSSMAFPRGPAVFAGWRAAVLQVLYPDGVPTTGADAITDITEDRTLPTGCVAVKEYTFNDNGGAGRSSTPIHAEVLEPATPIGAILLFCDGHRPPRWDTALIDNPLLATACSAGLHVIMCEMPNYGRYYGSAINITHDGETDAFGAHLIPWAQDSGPDYLRLWTDQPIRACNQARLSYGFTIVGVAALSGGGTVARYTQLFLGLPRRYDIFDINLDTRSPRYLIENHEFEAYALAPAAAMGGSFFNLEQTASSAGVDVMRFEGNGSITHSIGYQHSFAARAQLIYRMQLLGCPGSFSIILDPEATAHTISQWVSTTIVNDILSHL